MDARFPYSPAEVAKVEFVQFGILSPDEIVIPLASLPSPRCYCHSSGSRVELSEWSALV
jgi:hypothetical protein|uniref:Uncharacterized protein n=1 Tax=Zea mays TaxID=4577 RepID=B6SMH6_MAIZE|nr:hypothetical protein [Zea mays]